MPIEDRLMHVRNNGPMAIGNKRGEVFLCHAGKIWPLQPGDVASWPESVVEHAYKLEYCQLHLERLPEEEGAVVHAETMLRIAKENQRVATDDLMRRNKVAKEANSTLENALAIRERAVSEAEKLVGSAHPHGDNDDAYDQEKGFDLTPPKKAVPPPPPPEPKEPFPIGAGVPPVPPLQPRPKPTVENPGKQPLLTEQETEALEKPKKK